MASTSGIRTYCNPIDINYQYNFEQIQEGISYRSAADPVIVLHNDEYFLFATISGGWWRSKNLLHWEHVVPDKWPIEDVAAPAALSVGDTVYIFPSTFERRPILSTKTPENGRLEFFNRRMPLMPEAKGPWDPDIFHDPDTDRWFMYFGSSNLFPIYGIELDIEKRLNYIGTPKELIKLDPARHGWERYGQDHRGEIDPFIEGAAMNKVNGRYYLQYGAPGTEYNVYANGTYVGDDPLGPFTYAPYNPVSYKPGGFMTGAGHGNTFADRHGNFWNTGTGWIGVNYKFERRIVMFPAGFDKDGQMFSNTRFGDFPHFLPTGKWKTKDDLFTGWMLLSYRKDASASSEVSEHPARNLTDEDPRSFWLAESNEPGQTITIDLGAEYDVKAVQVNFADVHSGIFASDESVYTQFKMYAAPDASSWRLIADLTKEKRDRPNAYIELETKVRARYIRYEHAYVASPNLAISDIRVFGNGSRRPPRTPGRLAVTRDSDRRNARIRWNRVPRAVGYNILWGIAPDKLYQTYQRFADQGEELELRALTVDQQYYFAIEAFDENGVSAVSGVVGPR
jgi:hypothetical protein